MPTEDLRFYDGTAWQSLSALAAEQVVCELPISSADDTVKLDSPSANTFTVYTGGAERVTVTDAAATFSGQVQTDKITSESGASTDAQMIFRTAATLYANYSTPLTIESGKDTSFVNYKNGSADSFFAGIGTTKEFEITTETSTASDARFRLSTDCTLTKGDGTAWEPKSEDSLVTKGWVTANGASGTLPISDNRDPATVVLDSPSENTFTVYTGGQERVTVTDAAATFGGQVQTDKITSKDGVSTDAAIQLGATVTIDANQYTPLTLTNDKDGLLIRTINKDGRQYWHGQDLGGWCVATRQVIDGTPQAVRTFGVTGDYDTPDWRVYSGGFQADNWLKSPQVSGTAENDAAIQLGAELLTTNHTPTQPSSICTKQYADTKATLWTGTQDEYDQLGIYNLNTLYCITD